MTVKNPNRQSLELTPEQVARLNEIATQFELAPGIGPTPKRPSWRILIREIANGNLIVIRKDSDHANIPV